MFRSIKNESKKRTLKSLAECWQEFATQVIPPGASPEQMHRAEMTFYAGAAFMFDQNLAIADEISDDVGVAHLEAIKRELHDYAERLGDKVLGGIKPPMGRA